jgi:hypothetical protein
MQSYDTPLCVGKTQIILSHTSASGVVHCSPGNFGGDSMLPFF